MKSEVDGRGRFDWDEWNLDHIALHAVTADEAEEAYNDPHRRGMAAYNTTTERRWAMLGTTAAGRLLFLVYTRRGRAVRIITTRDADKAEERRYRRK